jgi:hypothetical protein
MKELGDFIGIIASPFPVYLYTKFSQFYNLINGLQSDLA